MVQDSKAASTGTAAAALVQAQPPSLEMPSLHRSVNALSQSPALLQRIYR